MPIPFDIATYVAYYPPARPRPQPTGITAAIVLMTVILLATLALLIGGQATSGEASSGSSDVLQQGP